MSDYIIRATASGGQIRAFAVTAKQLVEEARKAHNTSPVATAALGRLLAAGSMMGIMMKGEKDLLTLQIKGSGPLGRITVTADSQGHVKGYVNHPEVILPPSDQGKLDVGRAVGPGILNVIRDIGMKEPYNGQTLLQTSEIAEDLTYYFATSEQVPSAVGLGVLMEKNNTVKQAGGFIVQLMPFAEESVISRLEENVAAITSVTQLLEEGCTPEMVLERLLEGLELEVQDQISTAFSCNCTRSRVEKALISIGAGELQKMIEDGETIEMKCQFCNHAYTFSVEELKKLKADAVRRRK